MNEDSDVIRDIYFNAYVMIAHQSQLDQSIFLFVDNAPKPEDSLILPSEVSSFEELMQEAKEYFRAMAVTYSFRPVCYCDQGMSSLL